MSAAADATRQVALVTGASRGIGRAIARTLAAAGMRVIGTATTEAGAAAIGESLAGFGGCRGIRLDVNDAPAVDAAIEAIVAAEGGLHVLVNNAGITRDTLAMRMKDEAWDAVLDTNLKAVFRCCRAAIRPMMKQRFGRIVNITSVVGANGNAGQANYAAAKAGMHGFAMSLALEVASKGVTVNTVSPGYILTDMVKAIRQDVLDKIVSSIPVKRLGTPEEIASIVVWLASEDAGFTTGAEFSCNGGLHMS